MKPSLRDKESHQSPWCVTWPGPCHHRAPVVAEKYPPPLLPQPPQPPPPQPPSPQSPERESARERWGDRQTDRQRESRQRPCERVSYGTDLVLMTPTTPHHLPPLCAHPLPPIPPTPTSLRPGQYHPIIRNAGLFQLQCPMALPIQAPVHPSRHILPELTPDTRDSDSSPT